MNNQDFIKYLKSNGHININDEEVKKDIEKCLSARIELINYYTKLIQARLEPEIAIKLLGITAENDFTLKETELFIKHLLFVIRLTGIWLMREKERMLEITNALLDRLKDKEDRLERQEIINSVILKKDKKFRLLGNNYDIERCLNKHLVNLKDTRKGTEYQEIECVGLREKEDGNIAWIFMNHNEYKRYKARNRYEKVKYFEVLFYDK